ncbi:MAG: TRAP transporter small permease [Oscillospiraceae bacterium]
MKKIDKCLCVCEDTMMVVGILSAAAILFINVVMRNVFSSGLVWAEEFAKFAIIWITFGGCGAAARANAHMKISALYDAMGAKVKKVMDVLINLCAMIFSSFMVYYGITLTIKVIETAQVSPTMQLPMWVIYISVPIGGALMLLRYVMATVALFKKPGDELEAN